MKFKEKPILYDNAEYQRWVKGDTRLINSLLRECGELGQERGTYYNQSSKGKGAQHYPEVKYAVHLVKDGSFQPEYIYYEKYRLSIQFINSLAGKTSPDALRFLKAHIRLSEVFSEKFFLEFDKLCNLNADSIERRTNKGKICVDLCAINFRQHQVRFSEIKKYIHGKKSTEKVKVDQLLFLGFVRHIVDTLQEDAFRNEIYTVGTELIALVPKEDIWLLDLLREYSIEFNT